MIYIVQEKDNTLIIKLSNFKYVLNTFKCVFKTLNMPKRVQILIGATAGF